MPKILNAFLADRALYTSKGAINFDKDGVAEIDDKDYCEELVKLKNFSYAEDKEDEVEDINEEEPKEEAVAEPEENEVIEQAVELDQPSAGENPPEVNEEEVEEELQEEAPEHKPAKESMTHKELDAYAGELEIPEDEYRISGDKKEKSEDINKFLSK